MPTYTYECRNHKPPLKTYTTRAINEEEKPVICPQCKEPKTRIYVAPPTWFNGTGWGKDPK
jgi:putative FmdB family regulatory protein